MDCSSVIKKTRLLQLTAVLALLKVEAQDLFSEKQVAGSFPIVSAAGATTIYVDVQQSYLGPPETKAK